MEKFQSTRPRGARPDGLCTIAADCTVSIHAPARGATSSAVYDIFYGLFQSTRPRGARPKSNDAKRDQEIVSIHAPARGATLDRPDIAQSGQVSIHAPARGATYSPASRLCIRARFQSTRPRGARPCFCHGHFLRPCVSIHAPARGATRCNESECNAGGCFNPRARAGRDEH